MPTTTLYAGTPLWKEAGADAPSAPGTLLENPVFVGVTILASQGSNRPLAVTAAGDQGVLLARVTGPAAAGDTVGYAAADALVVGGTPGVGTVLDAVAAAAGTCLARVRVGSAGSALNVRGDWDSTAAYALNDLVRVIGTGQGTWLCLVPHTNHAPWLGEVDPASGKPYWFGMVQSHELTWV